MINALGQLRGVVGSFEGSGEFDFLLHNVHDNSAGESSSSPPHTVPEMRRRRVKLHDCKMRIVEQPMDRFRFRYQSEMVGPHGSLLGRHYLEKGKKGCPVVELLNYNGDAIIKCTLVDVTRNKLHPHKLVVRDQTDDVIDSVDVAVGPSYGGYVAGFEGMGIIHTAKKDIERILCKKYKLICKYMNISFHEKAVEIGAECRKAVKEMDLNKVCLRFTAHDPITRKEICPPVFSDTINNMKSAATGILKIVDYSRTKGTPLGDDKIYMFVEKVLKKKIKIRFFEEDDDGSLIWEDWGRFTELDVHHQYAIVFRTPKYKTLNPEKDVEVKMELFRTTDGYTSDPRTFVYKANPLRSKRPRMMSSFLSSFGSSSDSLPSREIIPTVVPNGLPTNPIPIVSSKRDDDLLADILMEHTLGNLPMADPTPASAPPPLQGKVEDTILLSSEMVNKSDLLKQILEDTTISFPENMDLGSAFMDFAGSLLGSREMSINLNTFNLDDPIFCKPGSKVGKPEQTITTDGLIHLPQGLQRPIRRPVPFLLSEMPEVSLSSKSFQPQAKGTLKIADADMSCSEVQPECADEVPIQSKVSRTFNLDDPTFCKPGSKVGKPEQTITTDGPVRLPLQSHGLQRPIRRPVPVLLSETSSQVQPECADEVPIKSKVSRVGNLKNLFQQMDSQTYRSGDKQLAVSMISKLTVLLEKAADDASVEPQLYSLLEHRMSNSDSLLHLLAACNATMLLQSTVRRMTSMGLSHSLLNHTNVHGESVLHYAVKYDQPALLKELLLADVDCSLTDQWGNSVVHRAVMEGKVDCLKCLLKASSSEFNVDIDKPNSDGLCPLLLALRPGMRLNAAAELTDLLLDAGCQMENAIDRAGKNMLHYAVSMRDHSLLAHILKRQPVKELVNKVDFRGHSPLHAACVLPQPHAVQLSRVLLNAGADPLQKMNNRNENALNLAEGNSELLALLQKSVSEMFNSPIKVEVMESDEEHYLMVDLQKAHVKQEEDAILDQITQLKLPHGK